MNRSVSFLKKHKIISISLIIFLVLVCAGAGSWMFVHKKTPNTSAQNSETNSDSPAGYVASIAGQPEIKNPVDNDFKKISQQTEVVKGTSIKTDKDSKALVVFSNNSSIVLENSSEVSIQQVPTLEANEVNILQKVGKTWSKIIKNTNTKYEIESQTTLAAVRGTIFEFNVDENQNSKVAVTEGRVEVTPKQDTPDSEKASIALLPTESIEVQKDKLSQYTSTMLQSESQRLKGQMPPARDDQKICFSQNIEQNLKLKGNQTKLLPQDIIHSCSEEAPKDTESKPTDQNTQSLNSQENQKQGANNNLESNNKGPNTASENQNNNPQNNTNNQNLNRGQAKKEERQLLAITPSIDNQVGSAANTVEGAVTDISSSADKKEKKEKKDKSEKDK
jgi:hypothetical protein